MNPKNSFAPAQKQQKELTFSAAVTSPAMQGMMKKALGSPAAAARVTSTLISAVAANPQLQLCDASTVVASALRGEGMGLIFGHGYYVVPYGASAVYVMSYKGYIQLAMSTGFYADIDCLEIRDGELEGRDKRTGKPVINLAKYDTDEERAMHPIIGYYGYFELKDGTFRFEYWNMDKLLRHADRYSKAFSYDKFRQMQSGEMNPRDIEKLLGGSPWYDPNGGQDKMCRKTVIRSLLNSGYAPLSAEVRTAFAEDAKSEDDGVIPDIPMPAAVVPATGEVVEDVPEDENAQADLTSARENSPESGDTKRHAENSKPAARRKNDEDQAQTADDYTNGFFS